MFLEFAYATWLGNYEARRICKLQLAKSESEAELKYLKAVYTRSIYSRDARAFSCFIMVNLSNKSYYVQ